MIDGAAIGEVIKAAARKQDERIAQLEAEVARLREGFVYLHEAVLSRTRLSLREDIEKYLTTTAPVSPWRPIAEAKQDGSEMLLSRWGWSSTKPLIRPPGEDDERVWRLWWLAKGHWSERWQNWNDGVEPSGLAGPTHFVPLETLPAPPAEPE